MGSSNIGGITCKFERKCLMDPSNVGSTLNWKIRAHIKFKANLKGKFDCLKRHYVLLSKNNFLEN